jgi:hypothetical protein
MEYNGMSGTEFVGPDFLYIYLNKKNIYMSQSNKMVIQTPKDKGLIRVIYLKMIHSTHCLIRIFEEMVRLLNLTSTGSFEIRKFDPEIEMKQLVYGPKPFGPKESERVSPEM